MEKLIYLAKVGAIVLISFLPVKATVAATVGVAVECPATGPGMAVCVPLAVILHEIATDRPFGPGGEVMKLLQILPANFRGSEREGGVFNKSIRVFGPSVKDIREHGIEGGPNSVLRKPFG